MQILEQIKYVDKVISCHTLDKFIFFEKLNFDILFSSTYWENSARWKNYEKKFKNTKVKIIYLPYTNNVSSSRIKEKIKAL